MPAPRPSDLRLVATDLDGTLLRSDGTVSERTRDVLQALEDRGVVVVFVTGRPIRWMRDLWQHVGDHGIAVCSNGAVVYDVAQHAIREHRSFEPALVMEVSDGIRAAVPGTAFALESTEGFAKEAGFWDLEEEPPWAVTGTLSELVEVAPTVKLLARHHELDPELFWARTEKAAGHLATITWSSVGAMVEISAPGVTKATTLAMLCDELGVASSEVVAFGDMPNDLAMLSWAGSSYAMAGAHQTVLERATHVAPSHDEDGVATVLEGLFAL